MSELFSKESVVCLVIGIVCGMVWYNFYLAPRDEALHAIMECMQDLTSKPEYDMCAQQLKEIK